MPGFGGGWTGTAGQGQLLASEDLADVSDPSAALTNLGGAPLPTLLTAVTVSGELLVGRSNLVNAASGSLTMTLPTGTSEAWLIVEKTDTTKNAVTVSGTINGVAGATIALELWSDAILFLSDETGNWVPILTSKMLSSLDGRYMQVFVATGPTYGADPTGVNASDAAINAAIADAAAAGGGVVSCPPIAGGANYLLENPLQNYQFGGEELVANSIGIVLVGAIGIGATTSAQGSSAAVTLTCGPSYPTGLYVIDIQGSNTEPNAGGVVRGFRIECSELGAGFRAAYVWGWQFTDMVIENATGRTSYSVTCSIPATSSTITVSGGGMFPSYVAVGMYVEGDQGTTNVDLQSGTYVEAISTDRTTITLSQPTVNTSLDSKALRFSVQPDVGGATGAFSIVCATGATNDPSYFNYVARVFVNNTVSNETANIIGPGGDGVCVQEGNGAWTICHYVFAQNTVANGFNTGNHVQLDHCRAVGCATGYRTAGSCLTSCSSQNSTGNEWVDVGSQYWPTSVDNCYFRGTNTAPASTTIAAGSAGVSLASLTGSQSLSVTSSTAAGLSASGTVAIVLAFGQVAYVSYGSKTNTTLYDCALVSGSGTLEAGMIVMSTSAEQGNSIALFLNANKMNTVVSNTSFVAGEGTTTYAYAESGVSGQVFLSPSCQYFAGGASYGAITQPFQFNGSSSVIALTAAQLAALASGGVSSFAGRTGAVVPESGDYTAAQVGALASSTDLSTIASANPTAAAWSNNGKKITNVAAGSATTDVATVANATPALEEYNPAAPTGTSSTTGVMMGLGGTMAYTPTRSGKCLVTITGTGHTASTAEPFTVQGYYGTGSAPVNGAATTGTAAGKSQTVRSSSTTADTAFAITFVVALTPGTAYWFDLNLATSNTSDEAIITGLTMTLMEA